MDKKALTRKLVLLTMLGGAMVAAPKAFDPDCSGNANACRDAGFSGCCYNACFCQGSPSVCTCNCC